MSVVTVMFKKFWGCLLSVFGIFNRLICRARRGRKNSGSILPMTADHIANAADIQQPVPSNNVAELELESWDSWGMEDQAIGGTTSKQNNAHMAHSNSAHYPGYHSNNITHQNNRMKQEDINQEPDMDFFQDMTPQFKKAKKILIKKNEDSMSGGLSSRLAMSTDIPTTGGELGTWDEGENAWGGEASEDLSWQAEEAIREKKRQDRERRLQEHQLKKLEREAQKGNRRDASNLAAVKLS